MSTVLSHAVEDELLPANPAFRLGRHIGRKGKSRASDIEPFTHEEASAFMLAVQEHMPDYYGLFLCALRTGLRLGELLALEWDDIDFHGGFLNVRRSRSAGVEGTPKNGKARRVDMSTQLAEELQRLLVARKAQKLANGWRTLPAKVFCASEGGPLDGDNVRTRVFYEVLKKAKGTVRRVRFHDLRHTFASLLIQNGESLVYVKEQLGHSSIQVTVDIYGHLIPGANRQAIDRLDEPAATPADTSTSPDASAPAPSAPTPPAPVAEPLPPVTPPPAPIPGPPPSASASQPSAPDQSARCDRAAQSWLYQYVTRAAGGKPVHKSTDLCCTSLHDA
jgi:integrase